MISILIILKVILAQEMKTITIGNRVEGTQAKWLNQNGDFYELVLNELKMDSDIVVMVKAINPGGDPNIFISKQNKYASNQKEGEIASCSSNGNDLCIIDKSQLAIEVPYYISIICPGNCRYELRVDYVEEYTLERDDFTQLKLSNTQQSEIIRINIGEYSKSETELEIEIKALNIYEFESEFYVYLNEGSIVPSSENHKYKAKDSWSGSKLISLLLQQLPPQSKLTMLISGQAGAIFQIRTRTYGIQRELKFQEVYNGLVGANVTKIFKVKIQDNSYNNLDDVDKKIKWFVRLTPFVGHATLYVNLDYQPVLLEQYFYHFEGQSKQILIIEKSKFKYQGENERYLYIAVFGNEVCTYELETGIQDFEYQYININVPYEGMIENNEMINYWFVLTGNKQKAVTVELTNYEEECFMVIKRCQDEECKIIEDDLQNLEQKYSDDGMDLFIYSNPSKIINKQMLIFSYIPEYCKSFGDFYSCTYVLAIHQSFTLVQQQSKCFYSLLISAQSSHVKLRENTPHKSIVERDNYNYFKFGIDDVDNISRISIILTPIQGNFRLYSSRVEKRPDKERFEKQGVNNMIRYGGYNEKVEKGIYYISVFGQSSGLYTIAVIVIREGEDIRVKGKFAWQYIQLYEGSPQDFSLFSEEVGLYKIDLISYLSVDQSRQTYQETVKIEILHESGELQLYGFDHPSTNLSESRWNSTEEIEIQFIDDNYPEVIYLRVEPTKPFSQVQFRIIYRIGWKSNMLVLNENFYTWIEKDEYQYFHYTFFKNEDVQLTKRAHSHRDNELNVTIFIGDSQHQLTNGTVVLSPSNMPLDKCKISAAELYYCQIYIQVFSPVSTFYSLLISKDDSQIQLTIDEPITRNLPITYHHYYLFYQQPYDVIINVVNFAYPQPLQILVSYFDINQYPNKGIYDYPLDTQSKNVIAFSTTLLGLPNSQITLTSNQLQQCYSNCVLAITVKLIEDLKYHQTPNSIYSIQYSSGATFLPESIPYYGITQKDTIKYYQVYVYDNDTNLMIVLTPMSSCDVNIVVSKDTYPNARQYQWASNDYLGDQLVIESGNPVEPNMAGLYFIGVIADQQCSYNIVYQTGRFHYYQIQQGIPYNLVLKHGEIAYFKYQQYIVEDFKILFKTLSGSAQYFIEEISLDYKDSIIFVKQIDTFQFNNDGKGYTKEMKFSPNDRNNYLIAVRSDEYSDFVIAIQVKSQKVYLAKDVIMINQLDPNESQSYSYFSNYDSSFKVEVLDGKIKVEYMSYASKNKTEEFVSKESVGSNYFEAQMANSSSQFEIKISALDKIATYKIQCRDVQSPIAITVGEAYIIQLNPKQLQKLSYSSVQQGDDNSFTILISMFFNTLSKTEYNKYKKAIPKILVKYTNQEQRSHQIIPLKETQIQEHYYVEFQEQAGDYEIEVLNNDDHLTLDFNLILSNSQLNVLIPNKKSISLLTNKPQYWEYYCPSEGQLLLQVYQCGLPLNLFGSNDMFLLKNGQYQKQYQINDSLIDLIEVKRSGYYYLLASPINSLIDQTSPFKITAQLVKQDSYIPIDDIKPGNQGNLTWQIYRDDDKYYLQVFGAALFVEKNPNFKLLYVSYTLFYQYTDEKKNLSVDYCFDHYNFQTISEYQSIKNFTLIQLLDQEKLVDAQMIQFNIYADSTVQLKNLELVHIEKFYNPINVPNEFVKQLKWSRYMKYTFLFSIIFVLLYTLYNYFRKKNEKQQMKFEATEYPNIEMQYRGLSD